MQAHRGVSSEDAGEHTPWLLNCLSTTCGRLSEMQRRFCTRSWSDLLQPAILQLHVGVDASDLSKQVHRADRYGAHEKSFPTRRFHLPVLRGCIHPMADREDDDRL